MTGCQPPAFLVLQVLLQLEFVCFFSAESVEVFFPGQLDAFVYLCF